MKTSFIFNNNNMHHLSTSGEIRGKLLDSFDNFLIDCDGVLWNGKEVTPNAIEAVNLIRNLGKKIFFVTNNSTKSRRQYVEKLKSCGFQNFAKENVYCSSGLGSRF